MLEKYPFIILLQKYGYLGVGCIFVVFISLLLVMANVARKQKTYNISVVRIHNL